MNVFNRKWYFLAEFIELITLACGSQEGGYEAGRLLVEQLIYQFGHEELISFTKAIVNTPGQDSEKWKVAFEKQFKISYDKWLENVVPEIEKREL